MEAVRFFCSLSDDDTLLKPKVKVGKVVKEKLVKAVKLTAEEKKELKLKKDRELLTKTSTDLLAGMSKYSKTVTTKADKVIAQDIDTASYSYECLELFEFVPRTGIIHDVKIESGSINFSLNAFVTLCHEEIVSMFTINKADVTKITTLYPDASLETRVINKNKTRLYLIAFEDLKADAGLELMNQIKSACSQVTHLLYIFQQEIRDILKKGIKMENKDINAKFVNIIDPFLKEMKEVIKKIETLPVPLVIASKLVFCKKTLLRMTLETIRILPYFQYHYFSNNVHLLDNNVNLRSLLPEPEDKLVDSQFKVKKKGVKKTK